MLKYWKSSGDFRCSLVRWQHYCHALVEALLWLAALLQAPVRRSAVPHALLWHPPFVLLHTRSSCWCVITIAEVSRTYQELVEDVVFIAAVSAATSSGGL
jgi:hypothetical protein